MVLTSDGKGIVMHHEDLRAATATAAERKAKTYKTRLSPDEKSHRKRMATVAAVYSTARYPRQPEDIIGDERDPPVRPAVVNQRVWASVQESAATVIAQIYQEAHQRDPEHQREWVVLVDGEEHQLDYHLQAAKQYKVKVTIVLDFIHVLEYLWKAAGCFFKSGDTAAEPWVQQRAFRLLEGKTSDVAAGIRRSAAVPLVFHSTQCPIAATAQSLVQRNSTASLPLQPRSKPGD